MTRATSAEINSAGLDDWRKLAQGLHARFRAGDASAAGAFVGAVATAGVPLLQATWRGVDVDVVAATRRGGVWVTPDDLLAARQVSELAAEHGLQALPDQVTQLEIALDTAHSEAAAPFWSALLSGDAEAAVVHGEVFDPTGQVPNIWFQGAEDVPTPPQRWHFDVWVAPEVAASRIEAAVAAGGVLVYDESESFTVLADPDGNRVCICVSTGRD